VINPPTVHPTSPPIYTPWGQPDQPPTLLAPGIYSYTTRSHGGIWLDATRNAAVPYAWKAASFAGRGLDGWYEEDCDWSLVAGVFPAAFDAQSVDHAIAIRRHWLALRGLADRNWEVETSLYMPGTTTLGGA
jgi:hypothetical protein